MTERKGPDPKIQKSQNDLPEQTPGYFGTKEEKYEEELIMYAVGSLTEPPQKPLIHEKEDTTG